MTDYTASQAISIQSNSNAGEHLAVTNLRRGRLNGIVFNQNQGQSNTIPLDSMIYQEFSFPQNYPRGTSDSVVPPFTGLQVKLDIAEGTAQTVGVDWVVDYYHPDHGWTPFVSGHSVGAPTDGPEVWMNLFCDPQPIDDLWTYRWRFGLRCLSDPVVEPQVCEYSANRKKLTINGNLVSVVPTISPSPLEEGETYYFTLDQVPSVISVIEGSGTVLYSPQYPPNGAWIAVPNPLAADGLQMYTADGQTPYEGGASLLFRVMGGIADSGRDYFDNNYRATVLRSSPQSVDGGGDSYWLSRPNPSRFAVEALYFNFGREVVIDQVFMDPITPNVNFNIYWTNDDPSGWGWNERRYDGLLWNPVPRQYVMGGRMTHPLPGPISTRYLKLEFTGLQARPYAPGDFQKSMVYKKYPKWVVDYYLALYQEALSRLPGDTVTVTYDALDLAFNYYRDDIVPQTDPPLNTNTSIDVSAFSQALANTDPLINQIDAETRARIRASFNQFGGTPQQLGRFQDYILSAYGAPGTTFDYSVEQSVQIPKAPENEIESQDDVVIEREMPPMSYYLSCRHYYRFANAKFEYDRAYFAGVREVAFLRENHSVPTDNPVYHEILADDANIDNDSTYTLP